MDKLKIAPWGPPKLRKIFDSIVDAINKRTPISGVGINVSEEADGSQISASSQPGKGGGGGPEDIYGVFNGAPAVFNINVNSVTPV